MTIALILKNATGSLFPVTNPAQGKPILEGFVEFSLDDKKRRQKTSPRGICLAKG